MVINKNKSSVCVVKKERIKKDGSVKLVIVGYLSNRDIENGLDSHLDMQGYIIEAL